MPPARAEHAVLFARRGTGKELVARAIHDRSSPSGVPLVKGESELRGHQRRLTLKMLFKSARRDGVVTEDPIEFLETVRRERVHKIKRPFRGVLAR